MKDNKQGSIEEQSFPERHNIRMLGSFLGEVIKDQAGYDVFTNIEKIRKLSKDAMSGDIKATKELMSILKDLPINKLLPITKAFNQYLNFVNIDEQHQQIRLSRNSKINPDQGVQAGTLEEVIPKLKLIGIDSEKLYSSICCLDMQFVLTSHPTEVKRGTMISKYDRIATALQKLDFQILTPDEAANTHDDIYREILSVWQTSDIRSNKPTAVDEAKWNFNIIEKSLWYAVPMFMRELDRVVDLELGENLPLDFMAIKIDSWLGGDRDGNPNVTPEVTRHVAFMGRYISADLLLQEISQLSDSLSMEVCNDKLRTIVGGSKEPYRDLLNKVQKKLIATKAWARDNFFHATNLTQPIFHTTDELLEQLMLCYDSLLECKARIIARGKLLDIIRQLNCFGLPLVRMDIRQEASKHEAVMSAITRQLCIGDYKQWTETERQTFLVKELEQNRPLITPALYADKSIQDILQTFKLLGELPRDGLGSYIISMASNPSDVLVVVLLQQQFGIKELLPVVPLFETYNDLLNSSKVIDALFSMTLYLNLIKGCQQIMIGYSDSAKDVGILAASWAQYCSQEQIIAVAKNYKVKIVFFHGRGGSLGRGGWPINKAILSQPPGTVNNIMRVTQQGEVIQKKFGLPDIAIRTFSVYITSILEANLLPPITPKSEWRELLNSLSRVSTENYRHTLSEESNFLQYFQAVTPIRELKNLTIGSRPDSRSNVDSWSELRAIPWIFAWTQNRLIIPSWAGVGEALLDAYNANKGEEVVAMRQGWIFFDTLLSMCEIVLSKADVNVAMYYEQRLAAKELKSLGARLRDKFIKTKNVLLRVLDHNKLLEYNSYLSRSIESRNHYLLPLHLLQIELLSRLRDGGDDIQEEVMQALLISVAGIAAGMCNTG